VQRVAQAIVENKTIIVELDLRAYFDNVQHSLLLDKVALRVRDNDVMHLVNMTLKATGKKGVPQGGVISPLLDIRLTHQPTTRSMRGDGRLPAKLAGVQRTL
jgi:RNA-directed DNA polymerase